MMKKSMLLLLIGIPILIIAACSTLPFPNTPTESLLVITGSIDREYAGGENKVSKVILKVERIQEEEEIEEEISPETFLITLKPGEQYGTAVLEPGEYIITGIEVRAFRSENKEEIWADDHAADHPFFIEERVVRLYERSFVLAAEDEEQGGYTVAFAPLTEDEKGLTIYKALNREPRWPAWERYQLVGFPEEVFEE